MMRVKTKRTKLNASPSYSLLRSSASYASLTAIDVLLDPDTKNRYFRVEPFSVDDFAQFSTGKVLAENFVPIDVLASSFGKASTDSLGLHETTLIQMLFTREFDDLFATSDNAVLHPTLGKESTLSMSEDSVFDTAKGLDDSAVMTELTGYEFNTSRSDIGIVTDLFSREVSFIRDFNESANLSDIFNRFVIYRRLNLETLVTADNYVGDFGKSVNDTQVINEVLARSVIYDRQFSDFFSLDDISDVSAKTKEFGSNKLNVFGFTDIHAFGTLKALQDSSVISDVYVSLTQKPISEAVSATDENVKSLQTLHADEVEFEDLFNRVINFQRDPDESINFTDAENKSSIKPLSESLAVSDQVQTMVNFNRAFAELVPFSDDSTFFVGKSVIESLSMSESINLQVTSLASSVFNASVINLSSLNN